MDVDNAYLVAAAWIGLALVASLLSIRLGISVALLEIGMGVVGGNALGLRTTPWIDFLAAFGSALLTFLAGAEIDPGSLRRHLRVSVTVGAVSFLAPFLAAFGFAYVVAGWDLRAAEIAGISLSTTSVAVVYAVMIESRLADTDLGKTILAACFITDLGTVLALGVLFADFGPLLLVFVAVTAVVLVILPALTRWFIRTVPNRVSEPEIKFLFLVLLGLGGLASQARSEAVLPAYLVGLAVAGVFVRDRVLVHRMRAIAFSILTPFYFIKAGLFVELPAVVGGAGLITALLGVKVGAKVVGVWPTSRLFGLPVREANYTTLLMSTGLTFGTISALFGLTNGIIDRAAYTVLVTVVILSAVVPTLIATTFFEPTVRGEVEAEEVEAADEIDVGPLPRPRPAGVPVGDRRANGDR
ncbi:MAG TPA: cation:proton antiporter [Candidatus Limnocylindrales bacterium]|nr:cation:proton antiporter [Candidatus Limnocylindrales bacterium]